MYAERDTAVRAAGESKATLCARDTSFVFLFPLYYVLVYKFPSVMNPSSETYQKSKEHGTLIIRVNALYATSSSDIFRYFIFVTYLAFEYNLVSLSQSRICNYVKYTTISMHTCLFSHFMCGTYSIFKSKTFVHKHY